MRRITMVRYKAALLTLVVSLCFTTLLGQQPTVKKIPARSTSAGSGSEMFLAYCASCHGRDGKGNGPAAAAMKVPPADLTTLDQKNNGKFPASRVTAVLAGKVEVMAHGSKDMPVWGPIFREISHGNEAKVQQRISNLTDYVESLQVK